MIINDDKKIHTRLNTKTLILKHTNKCAQSHTHTDTHKIIFHKNHEKKIDKIILEYPIYFLLSNKILVTS